MFFLQVILVLNTVLSGNCECDHVTNDVYTDTFKCKSEKFYISGLAGGVLKPNDTINFYLKGPLCCRQDGLWDGVSKLVEFTNWTGVLASKDKWADCPSGYFLVSLVLHPALVPPVQNWSNIIAGRCAKPVTHPLDYGDCYIKDVTHCFPNLETCSCSEGYYITGLYKSKSGSITSLNKMRCCSMWPKSPTIQTFDDLKTSVMEKAIRHLAKLADAMGYSNCKGKRGVTCAEDFARTGDTWEAGPRITNKLHENCPEMNCDEKRLKIVFGDWSLRVNQVIYGESVIHSLKTKTILSGTISNKAKSKVTESLDISKTVQENITHTMTKSFSANDKFAIELNFDIPSANGEVIKYKTTVNLSHSDITQKSTIDTVLLQRKNSVTLKSNSAAKYNVTICRRLTTVLYTAVLDVKFSTEFRGFLEWVSGNSHTGSNYHHQYKGAHAPVYYPYSFGDRSVSFHSALKRNNATQSLPWLWKDMFANVKGSRDSVESLLDETLYQYEIKGNLEIVSESNMDVVWENVKI